jgi:hypothetical protein
MFFEQIVPDLDVGVKVLRPHVGKHLFSDMALAFSKCVAGTPGIVHYLDHADNS